MQILPLRPAIAMIELIFALVVMAIVLMSAPMLISTAAKSTTVALQQEGINEAASRVSMIMTYPWDEKDVDTPCIPPVLHVNGGDTELDEAANNRRVGVPVASNSRTFRCGTNEFIASPIGSDGGDKDDMDDFGGTALVNIASGSGLGGKDYIEQTTVRIGTAIRYISDAANYSSAIVNYVPAGALPPGAAANPTSNIKAIDVTLTSASPAAELSKTITLHAFSCNIGGRHFEKRVMP